MNKVTINLKMAQPKAEPKKLDKVFCKLSLVKIPFWSKHLNALNSFNMHHLSHCRVLKKYLERFKIGLWSIKPVFWHQMKVFIILDAYTQSKLNLVKYPDERGKSWSHFVISGGQLEKWPNSDKNCNKGVCLVKIN